MADKILVVGGSKLVDTINLPYTLTPHEHLHFDELENDISKDFIPDLPVEIEEPFAGILNKTLPVICGGEQNSQISSNCYIIDGTNTTNKIEEKKHGLLTGRTSGASVVLRDAGNDTSEFLWITGGHPIAINGWTTEFVRLDQPTESGPDLPKGPNHLLH